MDMNCKLVLSLLIALSLSCTPNEAEPMPWIWGDKPEEPLKPEEPEEPVKDANPEIVALGWENVSEDFGALPGHIQLYHSPEKLADKAAIAYIAVADVAEGAKWEVLGELAYCDDSKIKNYGASSVHTPTEFYNECKSAIVINGGLFFNAPKSDGGSFYISQNLAIRGSEMIADNINYYSEDWVTVWHPTIGAFCEDAKGDFFTTWTYTNNGTTFCYPQPADNSMDKKPLPAPNNLEPKGARKLKDLNVVNAIGGVGVLLRDGKSVSTWKQELLDVSAAGSHPRTAIGYDAARKRLIFFVCEGRNMTEGVAGLSVDEVGEVMRSLGCTEALNLDGGGSTCMLVNGKQTIKPSDGEQRAVLSAVRMY